MAPREDRLRVPIRYLQRFALARSSGLAGRWLELLHVRHTRIAAPLRPARRPAQGLRLPRGEVARSVRSHHRHAAPFRDGPAPVPRDGPELGDLPRAGARRPGAGRPGILLLCAPGAVGAIRKVHGVFRIHQKQIVDFTPGRPGGRRGSKDLPGMPRSRWVLAQGESDQVVVWFKPKQKPSWMDSGGIRKAARRDHGARTAIS